LRSITVKVGSSTRLSVKDSLEGDRLSPRGLSGITATP
jgi:hypothetical protein